MIKNKIDKLMLNISFLYLLIPLALFILGWLKFYIAIPCLILIGISYVKVMKNFTYKSITINKNSILFIIIAIFITLFWVGLSGIGGFGYQNWDHEFRNALLRDLINFDWPVIYDYSTEISTHDLSGNKGGLIYYIGFWLPAALIGKVLGWNAANICLFIWSLIGVLLTLYLICRWLNKPSYIALTLLILFSGLDILGFSVSHSNFSIGQHIEWWAGGGLFQYSSNTTQLYWVYNQAIPIWVVTSLLLNMNNSNKSIVFTYSLGILFSPFPIVGLLPILVWKLLINNKLNIIKNSNTITCKLKIILFNIKEALTFENIAGPLVIVIILGLYFTSNKGNMDISGFIYSLHPDITKTLVFRYILFCLLEFLCFAYVLKDFLKTKPICLVALVFLILIPNYKIGSSNDFTMRASIPLLFILMSYIIKYIDLKICSREFSKIIIIIFLLSIGSITPLMEIIRSIDGVFKQNLGGFAIHDNIKTFSKLEGNNDRMFYINNFVGVNPQEKLFFKYLAK